MPDNAPRVITKTDPAPPTESLRTTTAEEQVAVKRRTLRIEQRVSTRVRSAGLVTAAPQREVAQRKNWRKSVADGLTLSVVGGEGESGEYAQFFDAAARLMHSGYPINQALAAAASGGGRSARLVSGVLEAVEAGVPLWKALADSGLVLPQIVVPILQNAELNGTVESGMYRLAAAFHRAVELNHAFDYSAGLYVSERIEGARFRLGIKHNAKQDRRRLRLPFTGLAAQSMATARWGRTFAILWEAGVPISTALEVAGAFCRNSHYQAALQEAARATREGGRLSDALVDVKLIPESSHLVDALRSAEDTGEMGPVLDQFAGTLEGDARERAALVVWWICVFLYACWGAAIVAAFAGPLAGLLLWRAR